MDSFETRFRSWAKENRLRMESAEDGFPIVRSRSRKYPEDNIFDGYDDGVGLFVKRPSQSRMTHLTQKLVSWGCQPRTKGEMEGIFLVPWEIALEVAQKLGMVKKAPPPIPKNGWFVASEAT